MTRGAEIAPGILLGLFLLTAQADENGFEVTAGARSDSLRWNIASDITGGLSPNILSELTWKDLRIAQLGIGWRTTADSGLHLRASASYGTILSGRNQDSDYLGDDRTLEFSRSNNDTDGDHVWDAAAAIGYRFFYGEGGDSYLIPLIGLSHHEQHLRVTNGSQTIPPTGPFPNLNTTYQTKWNGGWVGVEFDAPANEALRTFLRLEYHLADYSAEANWNLRADLAHPKSFEHQADGHGVAVSIGGYSVPVAGRWNGRFSIDYQRWETDPGVDRQFNADGTTSATRLNEVEWKSWGVSIGLQRSF